MTREGRELERIAQKIEDEGKRRLALPKKRRRRIKLFEGFGKVYDSYKFKND